MKPLLFTIIVTSSLIAQSFDSFVSNLANLSIEQRKSVVEKYLSQTKPTPLIEQDTLVHFIYYGSASNVIVNGALQHWNFPDTMDKIDCGGRSFFYRSFVVPPDARLDYQLIVDGKYQIDSLNPNITPSGFGPHSEVRMPKFISNEYFIARDSIPHGRIDSVILFKYLPAPLKHFTIARRGIKVYLPAGYDTLSQLPTVYVHDGNDAINFAQLPAIIDNLIADQKIPPIVAVFIPPISRSEEYMTVYKDKFVKILSDEIVPMIDKQYNTDRSRYKRAMMGISAGGHISLYTVFSRPDIFYNVGVQSSSITASLNELTLRQAGKNIFSPRMKIYLDCGRFDIKADFPFYGRYDMLELNRKFSALLSSLRIPHFYKEVNDGHEWANWRERMPEILIYFFGK